jgi:adenosine kinase
MKIYVTGSIAFDYIMVFPGKFRDHILADKMHVLSVSFLVDSLTQLRGGTGANIAYSLALLGMNPVLVGSVGKDFADYSAWLKDAGVDLSGVKTVDDLHTASCFINTDLEDNQITAFYPGAMGHAAGISLRKLGAGKDDLVIIAPNDPTAMCNYAAECAEAGIPYLYDPSMQIPRLTAEQLEAGCKGARILAGNDYEFGMLAEKMGITENELRRRVPITVMTRGEAGALVTVEGEEFSIPSAKPAAVVDPTGAGDAFRAGFVRGLAQQLPWPVVGRIAALTAVYAVENRGPQQHTYTMEEFLTRFQDNFGDMPEVQVLRAFGT